MKPTFRLMQKAISLFVQVIGVQPAKPVVVRRKGVNRLVLYLSVLACPPLPITVRLKTFSGLMARVASVVVDGTDVFARPAGTISPCRNGQPVLFVGNDSSGDGRTIFALLSDRPPKLMPYVEPRFGRLGCDTPKFYAFIPHISVPPCNMRLYRKSLPETN